MQNVAGENPSLSSSSSSCSWFYAKCISIPLDCIFSPELADYIIVAVCHVTLSSPYQQGKKPPSGHGPLLDSLYLPTLVILKPSATAWYRRPPNRKILTNDRMDIIFWTLKKNWKKVVNPCPAALVYNRRDDMAIKRKTLSAIVPKPWIVPTVKTGTEIMTVPTRDVLRDCMCVFGPRKNLNCARCWTCPK